MMTDIFLNRLIIPHLTERHNTKKHRLHRYYVPTNIPSLRDGTTPKTPRANNIPSLRDETNIEYKRICPVRDNILVGTKSWQSF
jgi:hypothetical protein